MFISSDINSTQFRPLINWNKRWHNLVDEIEKTSNFLNLENGTSPAAQINAIAEAIHNRFLCSTIHISPGYQEAGGTLMHFVFDDLWDTNIVDDGNALLHGKVECYLGSFITYDKENGIKTCENLEEITHAVLIDANNNKYSFAGWKTCLYFLTAKYKASPNTPSYKKAVLYPSTALVQSTHIDHIRMDVTDIEETITFYQTAFGFEIYQYHEGWAIIGNTNIKLIFSEVYEISKGSIDHFGFNITDYQNTLERMMKEPYYDGDMEWEHSRSFYIKDPDGHRIELSEVMGGGLDSEAYLGTKEKSTQDFLDNINKPHRYRVYNPERDGPLFEMEKLQELLQKPLIKEDGDKKIDPDFDS